MLSYRDMIEPKNSQKLESWGNDVHMYTVS